MKKLSLLVLSLCLLPACTSTSPSAPVPSPSASSTASTPSPSNPPAASAFPQASAKVSVEIDLSGLEAKDQALLSEQLFYFSANLANQPKISPSPLPASSLDRDLTPTAPAGVEVITSPAWGPLKVRAGQKIVLAHLPAGQPLDLSARLVYQIPGKLSCEQNASRNFSASARTTGQANTELKLIVTEIINKDLGYCEITTVSGRVTDARLQAIADARVSLRSLNSSVPLELSMQTDANGHYSFQKVAPGVQYQIRVEKAGYASAERMEVPLVNKEGDPNANRYDFSLLSAN